MIFIIVLTYDKVPLIDIEISIIPQKMEQLNAAPYGVSILGDYNYNGTTLIICNLLSFSFVLLVKGLSNRLRSTLMRPPVEILIKQYTNNIYAIAFNICKNVQDAEDVVQDTFIQYLSHKKILKRSSIYVHGLSE